MHEGGTKPLYRGVWGQGEQVQCAGNKAKYSPRLINGNIHTQKRKSNLTIESKFDYQVC